jgi:hypothetical protein
VFRRREWVLLAVLLLAYNINLRQVSSYDTYASRFVPISILRDGDVILDEFVPEEMKRRAGQDVLSDNFVYVRGHFYDSHAPLGPILALPVYAVPAWIGIPRNAELAANLFSKLAASIMVALSALAIFGASKRVSGRLNAGSKNPAFAEATARSRRSASRASGQDQAYVPVAQHPAYVDRSIERLAFLAALTYGLATSVWSTASLAMWTHTPAVLGFAVALWALTAGRSGLAGAATAAACFARPATVPAAAFLGLYLVHRALRERWMGSRAGARADVLWFVAGGMLVGLAGVLYNYWLFGNLVGGAPFRTEIWLQEFGTRDMFAGSLPAGFAGLTVSPSRGLLIYSPIVLVACFGAINAWRTRLTSDGSNAEAFTQTDATLLIRHVSLAALAVLLTYSKFIAWWGGHGYGPRYLTDAMPFFGLLFAPGLLPLVERSSRALLVRTVITVVLVYSVFIQAVGAFCWPESWTLNENPPYRYRLWDWRESQIESCIKDGPRIDPAARRLLARLGLAGS